MKRTLWLAISGVVLFAAGAAVSHFMRPPINVSPPFPRPEVIAPAQGGGVLPPPKAHVTTLEELKAAIDAAASDRFRCEMPYVIWVDDNASIDLDGLASSEPNPPSFLLHIPDCVTLASGRSATVDGGLLGVKKRSNTQPFMLSLGNGARVTGLRLRGPYSGSDAGGAGTTAVLVEGIDRALIDNNEIYAWPGAAVNVTNATTDQSTVEQIRVSNNFIHDNVMCGSGYGVVVGRRGYVHVDRNLFDDNRHAVSGDGCVAGQGSCTGNTGYIAELNFVMAEGAKCPSSNWFARLFGASYYNQHFDMHGLGPGCGSESHCGGTAGQFFDIRNNAIRGDQSYYNFAFWGRTRPALELRGTPLEMSLFRDNAVAHDNQGDAIRTPANDPQPNLQISNIQYNVDTSNELAVGDFDGDGCTDVFQATGAVWVYAPCGRREWRFLNQSSIRLSGLAFGDFDGDGKTDVFTQSGDAWLVSYGGTGPWTPLPAGSNIPMKYYGFADFDGDGHTDIFESNGQEWFYSSGGATQWTHLNFSKLGVKDVRFGHFNPRDLKKADVFAVVNDQWSVSFGGTSKWTRLNDKLSDDVSNLVFGDFNGDGVTDIAYGFGDSNINSTNPRTITWYVSWSGTSPWKVLNTWQPDQNLNTWQQKQVVPPLTQMLIGRFGGEKHDDVIAQMTWTDALRYFFWSKSGSAPVTKRSVYTTQ
jgi:hypothetical protein